MPEPATVPIAFESVEQIRATFGPFVRGVAAAIGPRCEIVLHDLSGEDVDLEHTIAAIVNGHVSGRAVGGPSSNFGFEVLADDAADHDAFGYRGATADGKLLRSSSVYFRNSARRIIAALCVNYDVSAIEDVKRLLDRLEPMPASSDPGDAPQNGEVVGPDLQAVVDAMIGRAIARTGKDVESLTREDRVGIVGVLDGRGVTAMSSSMMRIAERLGVSRSTAYQYLDEARSS